jgi:drug/metabolite transporter (DMT)-like permease
VLVGILLALASAVAYGIGDFYGGLAARRLRVVPATLVCYLAATVVLVPVLAVVPGRWSAGAAVWGGLSGVCAVAGSLLFFAALISGPISLTVPLVGLLESAVPVLTALILGARPSLVTWLAILLAVVAAVMVSLQLGDRVRMSARGLVLTVAAGVFWGGSIIALDRAPAGSGVIPAFWECGVGLVLVAALAGVARSSGRVTGFLARVDGPDAPAAVPRTPRTLAPALVAGVLLAAGNALLVVALRNGSLATVTVLANLYPIPTVLMAWLVARERLGAVQLTGVGLAVVASTLFATA